MRLGLRAAGIAVAVAAVMGSGAGLAGAGAPPRPSWYSFAPYVDMADYPAPDFPAIRNGGGVRSVSLGFVTASGNTKCAPTWGGYAEYPAAGKVAYQRGQIAAYQHGRNRVVVSFGGQAGLELARACDSVSSLVKAYRAAIGAYGATHVDFDIEGAALTDGAANTRRAKVIRELQRTAARRHHPLAVSFTLPAEPKGLDHDGLGVVRGALRAKVTISLVNVMAMDYGDAAAPNPNGHMGSYAIQSGRSLFKQLRGFYRHTSSAGVWRKVGVTPMLGINDDSTETFALEDARQVAKWARAGHIGMLGMWSLGRDSQCESPTTTTQDHCSGISQSPWAFSRALGAFRG
jgi:hypothetical protein